MKWRSRIGSRVGVWQMKEPNAKQKAKSNHQKHTPLKLFNNSASAFARFEFGNELANIFRLRLSIVTNNNNRS